MTVGNAGAFDRFFRSFAANFPTAAVVNLESTHKLILSGNDLPELHDPNDDGLKRRLLVIPFEQKFTDENRDPLLKKKLQQPQRLFSQNKSATMNL